MDYWYKQITNEKYKRFLILGSICFLIFCECFFFRTMYGSNLLFGDTWDGRLTMLFTEHWFHVFKDRAVISELGIFYPAENTIGYSDMFLGLGIIHSIFRFSGLDMYLSFKYTLLLFHAIGTFTCFYLLYKVCNMRNLWALLGTVAFSFSDSYVTSFIHSQLCTIGLLPLFAIFVVRFFQTIGDRRRRNIYAIAGIFTIMLILYTAWYIAFFSALFTVLFCICWLALGTVCKVGIKEQVAFFLYKVRWDLLLYIVIVILCIIPFCMIEIPLINMGNRYDYRDSLVYFPTPISLIYSSPSNLFWGWLSSHEVTKGFGHEVIRGFSIILLLLFVTGFIICVIQNLRYGMVEKRSLKNISSSYIGDRQFIESNATRMRQLLYISLSVTIIINILLMIRWNDEGLSGWYIIWHFFPGAKAIRAVARGFLVLNFPMAVCSVCIWNDQIKRICKSQNKNNYFMPLLEALVLLLLLVSNYNTDDVTLGGSASDWYQTSSARVKAVALPPTDVDSFFVYNCNSDYVMNNATNSLTPYRQIDAYEIADYFGIKTINGLSSIEPKDWGGIFNIDGDGYLESVRNWVIKHDLHNVYAYDMKNNIWIPFTDIAF